VRSGMGDRVIEGVDHVGCSHGGPIISRATIPTTVSVGRAADQSTWVITAHAAGRVR